MRMSVNYHRDNEAHTKCSLTANLYRIYAIDAQMAIGQHNGCYYNLKRLHENEAGSRTSLYGYILCLMICQLQRSTVSYHDFKLNYSF